MFNMHFICFLTSFKNKYSTILIAAIIISSNLFGQASKVGFGATAGSSNSPSGYLGVAALYNLSKKFQVGAGVGLSFASSFRTTAGFKYLVTGDAAISPILCVSYSYQFKGSKDYGEGLNDKRKFKYSSSNNVAGGAGINVNLQKILKNVDRETDLWIAGGYNKLLGTYNIYPNDPVNYNRDDFNSIKSYLFTSKFYLNFGFIIKMEDY
jgi:hypothetical protein